jgi:anti-sigma B factor antagonist
MPNTESPMRTETRGDALVVLGLERLTSDNVALFRDLVRATLREEHRRIEVDLSSVRTMDSEGVGALIAVHKRVVELGGSVRLLRPSPFILQLIRLLRLDRVLEVVE